MRKIILCGVAAAVLTLGISSETIAQPFRADPAQIAGADSAVTTVQYYGGGYGYRHRGYGYGYGGAEVGAGIAGLAAGAIIGGAIANSQQGYYAQTPVYAAPAGGGDAVAYCEQRFKSYDPNSGTYLGYDGGRHSCP